MELGVTIGSKRSSKKIILLISTVLHQVKFMSSNNNLRKNIFACLFSVHNRISLSRHEQVWLCPMMGEVSSPNILVHDVINLLYYKHCTDKRKKFYVNRCLMTWTLVNVKQFKLRSL